VILSTVLLVLGTHHSVNAVEVRCTTSSSTWCHITESVTLAEGDALTILNSDNKDTITFMHWTTRSNMTTIPAAILETFPKLLMFDIGTGIEQLSPSDFEKAHVVEYIDLSKNKLRRVPAGIFPKAPKVETIDFSANQIAEIEDNAFAGMNHLDTLMFEYNYITTLKRNTFAGAPKLSTINLRSNEISVIEPGTFDLPRLDDLDLAVNHLKTVAIPVDLFNNAPVLRNVDLSYNELTAIPLALFRNKVTVDSLVLDYNQLQDFKFSELLKIKTLKYVSLENTDITLEAAATIPQNVSDSLLDNIDLTANGITSPDILKYLAVFGNLETITLDQNDVTRINDIANVKTLLPNVTTISLQGNDVNCAWLREVLPAMKAAEIDIATGTIDEKIPRQEQGDSVDDQLCGKVPKN